MNRSLTILGVFIGVLLLAMPLSAQLSGTKTIGTGGDYATFAAAIADLNSQGVATGGVQFRIVNGIYTESTPLTIDVVSNQPSASAPVLFKPQSGATVSLEIGGQVTGARYGLRIGTATNSVDYVTLDGSNSVDGTTRDWTIKATAATYGIEPLDIYGDFVTIKNCIIDMHSGGYSGSGFGITFRDAIPTATYGIVQNCKVTGNNAISIGRGTVADMLGFLIAGNETHSLNRGIYLYRSSTAIVEDNEVIGDAYAGYPVGACYGIYSASPSGNTGSIIIRNNIVRNLGTNTGTGGAQTIRGIAPSGPGTYQVYGNRVFNLSNATSGTGSPNVYGIQLAGGGTSSSFLVYNNMVSGIVNDDADASASVYTYGIQYNTAGNAWIYHNTVDIGETSRDHLCAALQLTAGNVANTVEVKNNVFINHNSSATYGSYAVYRSSSLTSAVVSDYNDLYVDGSTRSFVGFWTADQSTLSGWRTASGQDANSRSFAVTFTSSTDLHISGPSDGDPNLVGTPIASVTTDIDGQTRSTTFPYMGADESATTLPVQLTSFTAEAGKNGAVLRWSTATETNCAGFEVEKRVVSSQWSVDSHQWSVVSGQWEKIGFVAGAGNSATPKEYSYVDNSVTAGRFVYRLKQLDNDGKFEYFGNAEIEIGIAPKEITLGENFPNPFNPSTTIRFSVREDAQTTLRVYDAIGREVATLFDGPAQAERFYDVRFDGTGMASGLYFYTLQSGNQRIVKRMLMLK